MVLKRIKREKVFDVSKYANDSRKQTERRSELN